LKDYIVALVNLYGIVHVDKVIEIFNMQNESKVTNDELISFLFDNKQYFNNNYVHIKDEYLVNMVIMVSGSFDYHLQAKKFKPFYIPESDELLKYKNLSYFEYTKEYKELLDYFKKMFFRKSKAVKVCQNIIISCQSGKAMQDLALILDENNIRIKNSEQLFELYYLIMNLANNTRIWENNGYTPNEMKENIK
jgi:hypothetical protein